MDEFKRILLEYGSASEAYGEYSADEGYKPSRIKKYEDAADRAFTELCEMYESAIERGECEMRSCNGSFCSASRPVYICDCGAFCTDYTDASEYHKPRYCPNCGRKVVNE